MQDGTSSEDDSCASGQLLLTRLAGCAPLPAVAVDALLTHPGTLGVLLRPYVLGNPHADCAASTTVTELAADGDLDALERTGDTGLLAAYGIGDSTGQHAVARNPNCPPGLLAAALPEAMHAPEASLRTALLTNVNTPTAAVAAALDVRPLSQLMLAGAPHILALSLAATLIARTHRPLAPLLATDPNTTVPVAVLTDRHVSPDAVHAARNRPARTRRQRLRLEDTLLLNFAAISTGLIDVTGPLAEFTDQEMDLLTGLHQRVPPAGPGQPTDAAGGPVLTPADLADLAGCPASGTLDQLLADIAATCARAGDWQTAVKAAELVQPEAGRSADPAAEVLVRWVFGPAAPVGSPALAKLLAQPLPAPGWQVARTLPDSADLDGAAAAGTLAARFADADADTWRLALTVAGDWSGPVRVRDLVTAVTGLAA